MNLPTLRLDGKVAIITGASGGIGKALSLAFAESGASLALVALQAGPLESLAAEITSKNGRALAVPADITVTSQVHLMRDTTLKHFGSIDILVNCAGGSQPQPALSITEESWDKTVDLNLKAAFMCSQAVAGPMIEQKGGCIINYASAVAHVPATHQAHYASAKAGLLHLTRVLAAEWGTYNIRVNCISPGLVDDELGRRSLGANFEKQAARAALGRAATPEDMVGLTLYLASDSAAYITGAVINVTGGPV